MSDINITVNDEIVNIDIVDEPVLVNVINSPGVPGAPGVGVPVGGTTGQVLAKNSATNYDTAWVNVSGGAWGTITGTLSNQTDLQSALDAKVPYTGATTNVDLGEYQLRAGQVTLDTSPTGTAAVGTTRWNDTIGSSETTLKGGSVILKNGVDLVARVVNKVTPNTTLTKEAYQAVRVSGAQGQRLAVSLAQANNDANSADTIGLVTETIATNQEGFIMTVGQIENINTTGSLQGETWADGDVLYLSGTTAGRITNVQPSAPIHIVVIGYVEYAHANNGKIYVKVMNGWELDELHDVAIVTPLNNEALIYESATALWKNKSIATALGYTPANAATTLTINGVTYDLSANRSWTVAGGISGSGASGQVAYWTGTSAQSGSNNLFWDATNSRLGIGTNAPTDVLDIRKNQVTTSVATITSILLSNTNASGIAAYVFTSDGTTRQGGLQYNNTTGQRNLFSCTYTAIPYYFGTDNIIRLMVTGSTGNIIIQNGGTFTDSGERLQVTGTAKITGAVEISSSFSTTGYPLLIKNTGYFNAYFQGTNANNQASFYIENNRGSFNSYGGFLYGGSTTTLGTIFGLTRADRLFMFADGGFNAGYAIGTLTNVPLQFGTNNAITCTIFGSGNMQLQNGGTFTDVASSRLTINSTTQGFLPPRMTTTQKNAIASPAAGLVVYDTTLNKLCVYTTAWETITSI
jgi:nitrogen fixation protein